MPESITYTLDHATSTVNLNLTPDRLIVNTQGKGLADRPRTIDIPISNVVNFAIVPTIGAQNLVAREGAQNVYDTSYDSEFIFTYRDADKVKTKRVFVNSQDVSFQSFLQALEKARPDASLTHLDPAEAQKQMGVLSASKALPIIVAVIVGIPVLIALIVLISNVLGR